MSRKDYWYEKEQLKIEIQQMGEDLCIHFYGGDRGHIGSVAMAEPRPSLTGSGKISATVSVYTYAGHKDDILASTIAREVSAKLNRKCVVAVGIHYDHFTPDHLTAVNEITEKIPIMAEETYGALPA
ncbi:prenylated flavin chaperone LpdD [Diplocloster modestus]|uniref:Prenylated flavin chaperone LpdD-like domain-containing protein n=1 Tax=Diplocloster modestus TaxID=2850322 RepID=A0ABS6KEG7_9FIRM|nr:hypothetical protein [Diplocloster modestus]MBU9728905.1 hypothetical protein [Diplocloster modestus]